MKAGAPNLRGARALVVGMGKSGMAAAERLTQAGASVQAIDQRPLAQLGAIGAQLQALRIPLLPQERASFAGAEFIVLSPGVPGDLPEIEEARQSGARVIGELELASYELEGQVIGITGSNGKTTTTALTGHILRASGIPVQVGGNIGTPPTAMVSGSRPEQWNVLELSSFQLETIAGFRAHIAVALNLTADHLDRHRTLERYAAAKGRLFETQTAEDFAVLNADDATCVAWSSATQARVLWFSLTRPVTPGLWADADRVYFDGEILLEISSIPLRGLHNVENTMAAAAASRLAGANLRQIAAAVKSFPGVEHRLEFVRELNGVNYYNDSKATNVDATLKALAAFPGGLWAILGGKDKNSDYASLRDPLLEKARGVLLIGSAAPKIAAALGRNLPVYRMETLEAAVAHAYQEARRGETVLLAPACASFDQFENFEHRGRVFKQIVESL